MRLIDSSHPGTVLRDDVMRLKHERISLLSAICRELAAATRDDFLGRRARVALDLPHIQSASTIG